MALRSPLKPNWRLPEMASMSDSWWSGCCRLSAQQSKISCRPAATSSGFKRCWSVQFQKDKKVVRGRVWPRSKEEEKAWKEIILYQDGSQQFAKRHKHPLTSRINDTGVNEGLSKVDYQASSKSIRDTHTINSNTSSATCSLLKFRGTEPTVSPWALMSSPTRLKRLTKGLANWTSCRTWTRCNIRIKKTYDEKWHVRCRLDAKTRQLVKKGRSFSHFQTMGWISCS